MRIKLEYDDGPVFGLTTHPLPGVEETLRYLMVRIDGKPFSVWRTMDPYEQLCFCTPEQQKDYLQAVDNALVAAMEKMFEKILTEACAAIAPGTELLK